MFQKLAKNNKLMAKNYVKILFLAIKRTAYPLNNSDHSIWGFWRWNIQWDYPFLRKYICF